MFPWKNMDSENVKKEEKTRLWGAKYMEENQFLCS